MLMVMFEYVWLKEAISGGTVNLQAGVRLRDARVDDGDRRPCLARV